MSQIILTWKADKAVWFFQKLTIFQKIYDQKKGLFQKLKVWHNFTLNCEHMNDSYPDSVQKNIHRALNSFSPFHRYRKRFLCGYSFPTDKTCKPDKSLGSKIPPKYVPPASRSLWEASPCCMAFRQVRYLERPGMKNHSLHVVCYRCQNLKAWSFNLYMKGIHIIQTNCQVITKK